MIEKEQYPASNEHPSVYSQKDDLNRGEKYKIDVVVNKMKSSAECCEIIYQFALGLS